MKLKLHTLLIVLGPNYCGKTHLIEKFIKPQLRSKLESHNIQTVSPCIDTKEEYLLHKDQNNKQTRVAMQEISVINKLKQYMDVPFSEGFIILECSVCKLEFINKCKDIALQYNYNVEYIYFNYKLHRDFFKFSPYKKTTQKQVDEYKKTILGFLTTTTAQEINVMKTIINKIVTEFNLQFDDTNFLKYQSLILNKNNKYFIIGDVHSCIDELRKLLLDNKFLIEEDIIKCTKYDLIFIGDLIDKGSKNIEMINFIHKNINNPRIKFVLGNHESTVYGLLTKQDKESEYKPEVIVDYFNTYLEIKDNPELISKFIDIYNVMRPFYVYQGSKYGHPFYVNHSPCSSEVLHKVDSNSVKKQIYKYLVGANEKVLNFFLTDKNNFDIPYQVVGHIQMKEAYFTTNNKIFIDTGCILGHQLTGVILGRNVMYPKFRFVNFMNKQEKKSKTTDINNKSVSNCIEITNTSLLTRSRLDSGVKEKDNNFNKIKHLLNNPINFISGTISPADKLNNEDGSAILESLEKCIEYYYNKHQNGKICSEIILMPKYMGSRINVYLFKEFDLSYGTTRNGYIAKIDKEIFRELHTRMLSFMNDNNIKMMLIDGELLPWSVLGQNLIDDTFKSICVGITETASMLKETGFDIMYQKLIKDNDMNANNKKLLEQQANSHISVDELSELGLLYKKQVEIYGKTEKPFVKGFGILKIVFNDDSEELPGLLFGDEINTMTNSKCFQLVNDDKILVLQLNDSYEDNLKMAQDFFDILKSNEFEGIVVRPNLINFNNLGDSGSASPYMKVRNSDYLRLIYGYDYQKDFKYKQLIKKKNIKKKVELTKEQFILGVKMLKIKYCNLKNEKDIMKRYVEKFLISDSQAVDPRL